MSIPLLIKPRMSEKAYGLSEQLNTYVFEVPKSASKQSIANAVSNRYKVTVISVRVSSTAAKTRRTVRKGGRRMVSGRSAAVHKAYVRLADEDKLPFFASVNQETTDTKEKNNSNDKKDSLAREADRPTNESKMNSGKPQNKDRRFGLHKRGEK